MKKKTIIKILSVVFSVVAALSSFTACENQSSDDFPQREVKKYSYDGGTHIYTAKETSKYMIQNGSTDYKIVIPADSGEYIQAAKDELSLFFHEATNVALEYVIESEEGIAHSQSGKYISIGETKMLESAGIEVDKSALGSDGIRIVTKDNAIYLFGGSDYGSLYAVYDLLTILFNFEVYSYDCIQIDRNVRNVKLYNFDVRDIPDVAMRSNSWAMRKNNVNNFAYRSKMILAKSNYLMPLGDDRVGGKPRSIHNSFQILPKAEYEEKHEKWYSTNGDQLCYTARGDQKEYEAMVEKIAEVIEYDLTKYPVDKYPSYNIGAFTMEDTGTNCTCSACAQAKIKYNSDSGAVIVMQNKIMEKVHAWMNLPENKEYKREDFKLAFFAYHNYADAPAYYDEAKGKYVVNHPDLVMREDVGVYLCMSDDLSYLVNVYDEINDKGRENLLAWFDIANTTYLWAYNCNFQGYLFMHASMNFFDTEGYQFMIQSGVKMLENQSASSQELTAFHALKAYLDYKLQWDCTLDSKELTQNWFDAMFGPASNVMMELFNQEREYNIMQYATLGWFEECKGVYSASFWNEKYWDYAVLQNFIAQCNAAKEIINKKVADKQTREMYIKHIELEWIYPAFTTLRIFKEDAVPNKESFRSLKSEFKTVSAKFNNAFETAEHTASVGSFAQFLETYCN